MAACVIQQTAKAINMGGENLRTSSGLVAVFPLVGTRCCRQRIMRFMKAIQGIGEQERLDAITYPSDRIIYAICVL